MAVELPVSLNLVRSIDQAVADCIAERGGWHPIVPVRRVAMTVMSREHIAAEGWTEVVNLVCRRCLGKQYVLHFMDELPPT